jgi:sulfite exporter TauE/SafE
MISAAIQWIKDFFVGIVEWFYSLYTDSLAWVLELFEWIPKRIFQGIMDGSASLIEAIPAPSFLTNAGSFFGNIPGGIVYFFQFFAIAEGIAMITAALLLRFILRRIPLIG